MSDDFTIAAKDDAALDALAELLARKLRTSIIAEVPPEYRALFPNNYTCKTVVPGLADPTINMYVRFDVTQTELRVSLVANAEIVLASVTFVFTGGMDPRLQNALRGVTND